MIGEPSSPAAGGDVGLPSSFPPDGKDDSPAAALELVVRCRLGGIGFRPDGTPFPLHPMGCGPRPTKALVDELRANFPAILAALRTAPTFEPAVSDEEIEAAIVRGMQEYRRDDPWVRETARQLVFERKLRAWDEARAAFRGLPPPAPRPADGPMP